MLLLRAYVTLFLIFVRNISELGVHGFESALVHLDQGSQTNSLGQGGVISIPYDDHEVFHPRLISLFCNSIN